MRSRLSRATAAAAALAAALLLLPARPALAGAVQPVTITVDATADWRPISRLIYGVNFADPARMTVVPYTVNRWGGNSTTRYNWRTDVHNTASDWFFMNVPDTPLAVAQLPSGSSADQFLSSSLAAGAQPLLTVPLIGFTPRWQGLTVGDARQKSWGFSIDGYGAQTDNECAQACQWDPNCMDWCISDAGNGVCTTGAHCVGGEIVGNDPADTSDPVAPTFVTDWMAHIAADHGRSDVTFYALDNEPMLWNSTHRDVHPQPTTYDELWQKTEPMAAAMKAAAPRALITGPALWGWCAYMTSGADDCDYTNGADIAAHGGVPFAAWYLDQMKSHQQATGVRLLDYLDIHYYPQGNCIDGLGGYWNGVAWVDCTDPANDATFAAARLAALKELYDPTWHSQDWIGQDLGEIIALVPRMRGWIAGHYAGTRLAITEYRWGTDTGPSSALAQAESLAIFGREGVDLATRWTAPAASSATEDAFRLFLDYDPGTAGFQQVMGDTVRAQSSNRDAIGSYAVRAPGGGTLWLLLFNHDTAANTANVTFTSTAAGPAKVFRFAPASGAPRITSQPDVAVAGNAFSVAVDGRTALLVKVQVPLGLPFVDGFETADTRYW